MKSLKGLFIIVLLVWGTQMMFAQTVLPATAPRITPEELIAIWESNEPVKMVIFNTGPVNDIKDAIHIGPVEEKKNIKNLKKHLKKLPKDTLIIYYCGCCPFATCPNLLPAYKLMQEMNFTQYKALDLPKSLKLDWINKGYPMKNQ